MVQTTDDTNDGIRQLLDEVKNKPTAELVFEVVVAEAIAFLVPGLCLIGIGARSYVVWVGALLLVFSVLGVLYLKYFVPRSALLKLKLDGRAYDLSQRPGECRYCGQNLPDEANHCPYCGGRRN